jgi:PAS domain S-box-containing protein
MDFLAITMDWETFYKWLGMAAAALLTCSGLWYKVVKPAWASFKKFMEFADQVTALGTKMNDKFIQQIATISHEISPNCGSSMKDALKRIENQLVDLERSVSFSEQMLKALHMDSSNGLFVADDRGEFIWANRTLCNMVGRSTESLLGNGWVLGIAPEYREAVAAEWNSSLQYERDFEICCDMVHTEGRTTNVYIKAYLMRNSQKQVLGYLGMVFGFENKKEGAK